MPTQAATKTTTSSDAGTAAPIVVDLGKKSRKNIRRLRKGRGKLLAQVQDAIEGLRESGDVEPGAQPVIVVVRRQDRQGKYFW